MSSGGPAGQHVMTDNQSLWPRLAELPLVVEDYEPEGLSAELANGMVRLTIQIRLRGAGHEGLGEDVSPFPDDPDALRNAPASLPLAGEWTLGSFSDHLATLDQWSSPPEWEAARRYRNWAFESAARDLALRQAGRALHEVLEREPRPLTFVNSLGLGDPPSTATIHRRRARYPDVSFKLDSAAAWTLAICEDLAATGAVEVVDFKGQYGMEVEDAAALAAMYERVVATFPDAILEDPHDLPEVAGPLAPHVGRVSYDAPIHSVDDLATTPVNPIGTVNIKPCRTGGLRALLALYAHCEAEGIRMYGGGMGENGVGRGQIQLLAAIFHPDGPNDVAPSPFNQEDPPEGLPSSPLPPQPEPTGFRRAS
jgi:L-alanine-DL-glutamate epimerase-like enolase superfamily enzyme